MRTNLPNGRYKVDSSDYTAYYNDCGDLHREDGPAVIFNDGSVQWIWHGEHYKYVDDYCKHANITNEDKLALQLKYGT